MKKNHEIIAKVTEVVQDNLQTLDFDLQEIKGDTPHLVDRNFPAIARTC